MQKLIESGIDTPEAILDQTGLGSYGCCSKEIVPLLIEKYKNRKDIDIQAAVFEINKKKETGFLYLSPNTFFCLHQILLDSSYGISCPKMV